MGNSQFFSKADKMTERAEAAYAAYGAVTDYKNFQGNPMPKFENLTPTIQQAWDAACEGVLRHWLEHTFKDAINDDAAVEADGGRMIKVGMERGDNSIQVLRVAITSFVVGVIAPEILPPVKRRGDL